MPMLLRSDLKGPCHDHLDLEARSVDRIIGGRCITDCRHGRHMESLGSCRAVGHRGDIVVGCGIICGDIACGGIVSGDIARGGVLRNDTAPGGDTAVGNAGADR
jgi:hypothetical protein